ncbi:MAG: hypothetical protein GXY36_11940 [Chloroflexi bacterium]|nr:hypothetical protein [Chloroflexota bacterium]
MYEPCAECSFPPLAAPYDGALRAAAAWILARFEVRGIIASGTIIRGNPGPSSDLGLYVIHARPQRQRLQYTFEGVPAEIFVNPVRAIERYFRDEREEGRPITAHMLATGYVVLRRDDVVDRLREQARALLDASPDPGPERLRMLRYVAATSYEDARDMAEIDPATAGMILGRAVREMLHYRFWHANRYLPRDKDLLDALRDLDAELAGAARAFYSSEAFERRLALAAQIADQTIGVHGFFEWESPPEDVAED